MIKNCLQKYNKKTEKTAGEKRRNPLIFRIFCGGKREAYPPKQTPAPKQKKSKSSSKKPKQKAAPKAEKKQQKKPRKQPPKERKQQPAAPAPMHRRTAKNETKTEL